MPYQPLTALGLVLHLSLSLLWEQLRNLVRGTAPLRPEAAARIALAQNRLHGRLARLDRLALRWLEGSLPRPRPRRPRAVAPMRPQPAPPVRMRDPSGHAWLVRIHQPAAQTGALLEHMLATRRDIRALVQAAPQAGRLLRPLCRMLGARLPEWLRLPPRACRPRLCRPRPQSSRPPRQRRPSLADPGLKLQPYVIAAARAWRRKFG